MKTYDRAASIFGKSAERTIADCRALVAEHSAKGLRQSGATVKRSIHLFEENSKEALQQILQEVANKIENRGPEWNREMKHVETALEHHIQSAPTVLDYSLTVAGAKEGAVNRVALEMIDTVSTNLRADFLAFKDGWTSPRPKPWRERNAVTYAILLIVFGAIVTQIFNAVDHDSNPGDMQNSRPISTPKSQSK